MNHVLYLSHNGMTEPLGQSQVLPYLRGVCQGAAARVTLLACEPPGTSATDTARLAAELAPLGIRYLPLQRAASSALLDKGRDSLALLRRGLRIAAQEPPTLIHARGQLPTAVALALRAAHPSARVLFDCRGLLSDEYVDMGHWRRGEPRQRLTAAVEARLWQRADAAVVLTQALRDELCGPGGPLRARPQAVVHIPCCADTQRFRPDPVARARVRTALGVPEDTLLLVFAGSMARYDMAACLRLLQALRAARPARLLLLTRAAVDEVRALAAAQGLPADALLSRAVAPAEVPAWLAACDLAAAFLQPWRSSIATSPTKVGEYLASGLPTVVSSGIADGDRLVTAGLCAAAPSAAAATAATLLALLQDPSAARAAARASALRHFALDHVGVARYRALYQQLGVGAPERGASSTGRPCPPQIGAA